MSDAKSNEILEILRNHQMVRAWLCRSRHIPKNVTRIAKVGVGTDEDGAPKSLKNVSLAKSQWWEVLIDSVS